ncbi:MAG TPA: hypothetical protein VLA19_26580 [Herpetosiphonaceae bacterium]|nr:hypothetical protein [Herpetosiphonaceae bacterium]
MSLPVRSHIDIDPFTRALACAALSPGLRSILIFDSPPLQLQAIALKLAAMLESVHGGPTDIVMLGSVEAEDELWGELAVCRDSDGARFTWQPARLLQAPQTSGSRIIVIPDLARLALPAARASITLMDAPVAFFERHRQHLIWSPSLCWLATCSRAEVGEVSPHLLDRFALRVEQPDEMPVDRSADVYAWVAERAPERNTPDVLPPTLRKHLQRVASLSPTVPRSVLRHILSRLSTLHASPRRELALARLTRTLAQLEGRLETSDHDVMMAAALLRLPTSTMHTPLIAEAGNSGFDTEKQGASGGQASDRLGKLDRLPAPMGQPEDEEISSANIEQVAAPEAEFAGEPITLPSGPYPEDVTSATHDFDSLRLPPRRYRATTSMEGVVIGTQRASGLRDLALTATIIEAAKYQKVRDAGPNGSWAFEVRREDLQTYRRAPKPEQMLVLVLDYTCLTGFAWEDALLPHLTWAYVSRASICLVQVGRMGAKQRLRAEMLMAPRFLDARLDAALREGAGTATPLAHGLDLAAQVLRTALQRGRGTVQRARLVVLSDGRGNVPLDVSRAGGPARRVTREGIDDAITIARRIRALNHVDAYLLNPTPRQYPELPVALAKALGASVLMTEGPV